MPGIISYGVHVPHHRLHRSAIRAALGAGGGAGLRAVASYDEDTTSMGVEAARAALRVAPDDLRLELVVLATSAPAYADKTNASTVHAALSLDESVGAYDAAGSVRSTLGALRLAVRGPGAALVVASDIRTGRPGSADESSGGDGAVALVVGDGPDVIAEVLAVASASAELLERWRAPGQAFSQVWEERFGETEYVPRAHAAATDALKQAGLTLDEVDHVVVTGVHARAVRAVTQQLSGSSSAPAVDLAGTVGNTGAAQLPLALAEVLDRAGAGETILTVSIADGADAIVWRTTEALSARRATPTVAEAVARGDDSLEYASFLTWRHMLEREPPRRPEPEGAMAPAAARNEEWKFAFIGARCDACGSVHLPPRRVCVSCGAVDQMIPIHRADAPATIATFTVDRLAFSPSPPIVAAVIDFDGGGRFQCELTDVREDDVAIGQRVELTFRRLYTAPNGAHNYFWKARPIRGTD